MAIMDVVLVVYIRKGRYCGISLTVLVAFRVSPVGTGQILQDVSNAKLRWARFLTLSPWINLVIR